MAGYLVEDTRKVTTHRLIEMKQQGKKIAMLTSYDYTMARIVDGAGVDVILVGDKGLRKHIIRKVPFMGWNRRSMCAKRNLR